MFIVWQAFLEQPQVFISSCAAVISIIALILQFVLFKLNGSRIKVTMSLAFYEPEIGKFFNYPVRSSRKDVLADPGTQKLATGNIRREFNNAEGIELLKVTISNKGRFPAKITDITFGHGAHGKEYRHYFSKYTIGLRPYAFSSSKTIPSLPQKIDGGDEFSLYYDYWDVFRDLQNTSNRKSNLKLHSYVKIAGKKREKKSKDILKFQINQSTTLGCELNKIPLRIILARYFYGNQSEQNKLKQTDIFFLSYYGNFSFVSRLLESFLAGRWPESYSDQVELLKEFFNTCHVVFGIYYDEGKPDCRYSSTQSEVKDDVASQIAISLPLYIEKWKSRINWSDIDQTDLYDKWRDSQNKLIR